MEKSYFTVMFSAFFSLLAVCGVLRTIMRFLFIDTETGFYTKTSGIMPAAFNIILAACIVFMIVFNNMRKVNHDYPVENRKRILYLGAAAVGVAILLYVWLGMPEHFGQSHLRDNPLWESGVKIMNYSLGSLAGIAMIITGLLGFFTTKRPVSILLIIPAIWQLILLVSRFNGYFSVLYISDNLLAIFFMMFASLFYIGYARTLCGFARKDGRNYVISTGLAASLCGFLLTVPNFIFMIINPATAFYTEASFFEYIYILAASIYSLKFVLSYSASIKYV